MQIDLAARVETALRLKSVLVAEAGVGTGKTLAYLIPTLRFNAAGRLPGPIVIATRTINLMEQMRGKDFPLVTQALGTQGFMGQEINRLVVIKGQRHYPCLLQVKRSRLPKGEKVQLAKLIQATTTNGYGDRATEAVENIREDVWEQIRIDECSGEACPESERCPYMRLREALWKPPDVILTNHNLLAEHLHQKARKRRGYWPAPGVIIVDEAHWLEEAIRQQLAHSISAHLFKRLVERLDAFGSYVDGLHKGDANRLSQKAHLFFDLMWRARVEIDEGLSRYHVNVTEEILQVGRDVQRITQKIARQTDSALSTRNLPLPRDDRAEARRIKSGVRRLSNLAERATEAMKEFLQIASSGSDSYAAWLEVVGQQPRLVVAPLDVSRFLKESLWSETFPVVLTSATLKTQDGFNSLGLALGLSGCRYRVTTFTGRSEFDYNNRVRVYVPTDLPDPPRDGDEHGDELFTKAVMRRIEELLRIANGRTLVLFTSHRRMNATLKYLLGRNLPFRLLSQGMGPVSKVLHRFRDEESSVLLATGAFWEGTDVEGPSLSQVIMDKLPFPNPKDPLVEARARVAGEQAREKVYLPGMVTLLRQGAGRLIRSERDWGTVAVLDGRARKRYFELVQSALPPAPWTDNLEELAVWFRNGGPDPISD